ncbi:MAG: arginine--tRNA ligase [Ruminococcaceae bacterium]|nr:arginine--tRNA ligase [Oscillospiraceae bacterium]
MNNFKNTVASDLLSCISELSADISLTKEDILDMFEYPPDSSLGDIAFPCFKLSRILRKAPPIIAKEISESLKSDVISKAEAVNGYLNIFVSNEYLLSNVLFKIEEEKEHYGSDDSGKGKVAVFDYSSPNVAKPFHIGHLGTTIIGHSLKMLHQFQGYDCVGINYLGDWGTQFGKLIVAYNLWGNKEMVEKGGVDELVALYVKFHEEAEKDETLNQRAREEFTKLEHHDETNIALWKWFVEISLTEYKKTYKQLGIEFDSYKGESFYTDKMPAQIEILREKNLLKIDGGASIVDLSEYNMPPCLILKRDGSTLYPTRDIAAAVYRKQAYKFDKCIYVTSAGQSLHFAQWFKVVELMGYDWHDQLVHVPYGTVSINNEKLATRTGNVILLKDLFATAIEKVNEIMDEKNPNLPNKEEVAEAVGVGSVIFYYLYNNRIKDINFVMKDALSFDGNTGPYAQYTYARTSGILDKAKDLNYGSTAPQITTSEEADLLKVLSKFNEAVRGAIRDYEPSIITRYIIDVCSAFNKFYHNCQIVSAEDETVRNTRIRLTSATKTVLGSAFELICLKKTEKI